VWERRQYWLFSAVLLPFPRSLSKSQPFQLKTPFSANYVPNVMKPEWRSVL
jgi:hypothetical protein